MLVQCWSTVYDAGPTLDQHWVDVSCLWGIYILHLLLTLSVRGSTLDIKIDVHRRQNMTSELQTSYSGAYGRQILMCGWSVWLASDSEVDHTEKTLCSLVLYIKTFELFITVNPSPLFVICV